MRPRFPGGVDSLLLIEPLLDGDGILDCLTLDKRDANINHWRSFLLDGTQII
jgi:hypothetical protein